MSRFIKELRVIPAAAWVIGLLLYAIFPTLIFIYVLPTDPEIGRWPRLGQGLFVYGLFLFLVAFVALIGYVYGDARRRRMRAVLWTLLAIFIPYAIGFILYFILRDPLPRPCPGCGNVVKSGFVFCPHCGTSLQPTCPNCGKGVERGWANCPHCGQALPSKSPRAA
jgi:Double zinc ribbon